MGKERMPSEIISDFIELCKKSHDNFYSAKQAVEEADKNTWVYTHNFEDAKERNYRNRLGYQFHVFLNKRRENKDEMLLWKSIHEFSVSEQNKPTLKRLENLLSKQIQTEDYVKTPPDQREYKGE